MEKIMLQLQNYSIKTFYALIVLIVGTFLVKIFIKFIDSSMKKSKMDVSLRSFLSSLINIVLKMLLYITVASMLGIKMTSFITVLGAAGLAIGFALQGSLSNFAGGVLILMFRPFNVGDFVEAQGYKGIVQDIHILYTIINTKDNRKVIIPNGNLANNNIMNYSTNETRGVDLIFGVGYDSDIDQVKEVILELAKGYDKILKDPEPFVGLSEQGDSALKFFSRVWCNRDDYWDVYYYMVENSKKKFDSLGINIPYPQMDVHLKKQN